MIEWYCSCILIQFGPSTEPMRQDDMKPTTVSSALPPVSSTLPLDFMDTSPPANAPSVVASTTVPAPPPPLQPLMPASVDGLAAGDTLEISRTASYTDEFLKFSSVSAFKYVVNVFIPLLKLNENNTCLVPYDIQTLSRVWKS